MVFIENTSGKQLRRRKNKSNTQNKETKTFANYERVCNKLFLKAKRERVCAVFAREWYVAIYKNI